MLKINLGKHYRIQLHVFRFLFSDKMQIQSGWCYPAVPYFSIYSFGSNKVKFKYEIPDSTFSDTATFRFCMAVWIKEWLSLILSCSNLCPVWLNRPLWFFLLFRTRFQGHLLSKTKMHRPVKDSTHNKTIISPYKVLIQV